LLFESKIDSMIPIRNYKIQCTTNNCPFSFVYLEPSNNCSPKHPGCQQRWKVTLKCNKNGCCAGDVSFWFHYFAGWEKRITRVTLSIRMDDPHCSKVNASECIHHHPVFTRETSSDMKALSLVPESNKETFRGKGNLKVRFHIAKPTFQSSIPVVLHKSLEPSTVWQIILYCLIVFLVLAFIVVCYVYFFGLHRIRKMVRTWFYVFGSKETSVTKHRKIK
jgi:hypothetical protein